MAYCSLIFNLHHIFTFVKTLPKPVKLSPEVSMKVTVDNWREHSIEECDKLGEESHVALRRRAVVLLRENGRHYFQQDIIDD